MHAEYKRDVSHNYLILQEEKAVDTSSYQVRMLTGNVIPSILKCHLQNLDGEVLFYYDITSKQSIATLFEDKKLKSQDLQSILEGFVKVMEEMAEFLMNTDQLVLQPEYIYMDAERKKVYFCCIPGYQKEIQGQFRGLTEYILPKIDHEDNQAVILGYRHIHKYRNRTILDHRRHSCRKSGCHCNDFISRTHLTFFQKR